MRIACLLLGFVIAASPAWAQFGFGGVEPVTLRAVWNHDAARPGGQRVLAIVVDMQPKWHINPDPAQTRPVGDFHPLSTTVTPQPADGLTFGPVQFPEPHAVQVDYASGDLLAFKGQTIFYLPVDVAPDAAAGQRSVKVDVFYQACDDRVCLAPQTVTLEASLTITTEAAADDGVAADPALFSGFDPSVFTVMAQGGGAAGASASLDFYFFTLDPSGLAGLTALLLLAALGGALLNFTPCVLPVIPIKIMGLAQSAGNRRRCFLLGLSMSAGVVAFWLGIGVLIASLTGFTAVNQLFQKPLFTIGVGVFIAVMAVGMCGLFAVRLPNWVYAVSPKHDSHVGSFGFGIMTAVLSTPCTAPFMGAAAAWAALQPAGTTLTTFGAIGAGMAAPYLVLAASPGLVDKMPRTGPASELIKQVMGLLMLAAAAYFVGVGVVSLTADGTSKPSTLYWWGVAAFLAAAGGWLAYRTVRITPRVGRRAVFAGLGVALIAAAGGLGVSSIEKKPPIDWVYYTPQRFEQALADGNVVMMDFTAEWCLNCKVLEATVLNSQAVIEALRDDRVVAMKVDLTGNNVDGNAKLKAVDRVTIPLLVVFAPDGAEVFKADFYTPEQVVAALAEARADAGAFAAR